jgi:phenylalanyl-tRNA synthetase beta chain
LSGWWGKGRSAEWSDAIDCAAEIIRSSGNTFEIKSSELAPWHPGRCAEFIVDGKPVAHAGELHPRVVSAYGLPPRACAFVVILDALPFASATAAPAVWTMPAAIQDISLIVDAKVSAHDVERALRSGAGDLLESITLFDRYDKVGDGKISLAFTMVFRAHDRTLTAEEVSALREKAGKEAELRCGATIRSN